MADRTAYSSQPPPLSQPPSTDEVDSGWLGDSAEDSDAEGVRVVENSGEPLALNAPSLGSVAAVTTSARSSVVPDPRELESKRPSLPDDGASSLRPPRASTRPRRGAPSWLVVTLLLAAVAGLWVAFQRGNRATTAEVSAPNASAEALAAAPAPPVLPSEAAVPVQPTAEPAPAAEANAAPIPVVEASAAPAATPTPSASGKIAVTVRLSPREARLYRKGRPVGSDGVVITLEPGERRSFEVGRRGFLTRKLVLDGSVTQVHIGLRPDPAAPPPSTD